MKNITNPKEKDNIISEVLRWLKEDNEKGWLTLFYDSLIIFYCTGIYTSSHLIFIKRFKGRRSTISDLLSRRLSLG